MNNRKTKKNYSLLPDISHADFRNQYHTLNRVGMRGIETMVQVNEEEERVLSAKVDIFVNLTDPQVRGIHMSRIYQILFKELPNRKLTPKLLKKILKNCVESQRGISSQAYISLSFTLPLLSPSLVSGYQGIRHYPIVWEGEYVVLPRENFSFFHSFQLLYSSTCPCSTALSEDLQEKLKKDNTSRFLAIPHAQRSEADITLNYHKLPRGRFIAPTIHKLEKAIKTPVQAAVKREDEQEFARLNAENQMFCEDAARTLKRVLEVDPKIYDYRIQVSHLESLHAHNAVAITVKGIAGGLVEN